MSVIDWFLWSFWILAGTYIGTAGLRQPCQSRWIATIDKHSPEVANRVNDELSSTNQENYRRSAEHLPDLKYPAIICPDDTDAFRSIAQQLRRSGAGELSSFEAETLSQTIDSYETAHGVQVEYHRDPDIEPHLTLVSEVPRPYRSSL